MKLPGVFVIASLGLLHASLRAADATSPIDYTERNGPLSPAVTVVPEHTAPQANHPIQDRRVEKSVIDKQLATTGDRRSSIVTTEAREKLVRDKESWRPEVTTFPTSVFNHREASISTADDTRNNKLVAKYQDSLAAASASNMARFPAHDPATTAKINRFVFRKNAPETAPIPNGAAVVPAGGGSAPEPQPHH